MKRNLRRTVLIVGCIATPNAFGSTPAAGDPVEIRFGPVPGFTTSAHPLPERSVLPVGATVPFRVTGVDPLERIRWHGPGLAQRGPVAWFPFLREGATTVSCELVDRGVRFDCPVDVRPIQPADLGGRRLAPSVEHPFPLTEDMDNEATMRVYFRWLCVGELHRTPDGYAASVGSTIQLRTTSPADPRPRVGSSIGSPEVLGSLFEWRLGGRALGLGSPVLEDRDPGVAWLAAGPPGHAERVRLHSYEVDVEQLRERVDASGASTVLYEARTEPPGFAPLVRWVSSTKYGTAEPTLGWGTRFAVTYRDTFGPDGVQWVGVRGDEDREGRDRRVDIDVDTDRDEAIEDDEDEEDEDKWVTARGAIFSVNHDRDGTRTDAAGDPLPDAVHFDDGGNPVEEDDKIDNAADVDDITPFEVRTFNFDKTNQELWLVAKELEDIQSIHVFHGIAAGNRKIWGSLGNRISGGTSPSLEHEISCLVPENGTTVFGLEGLFHANTQGAASHRFDGEVGLILELRMGGAVVARDEVVLKVAPWLMIPHPDESTEVWAGDYGVENEAFLHNADAEPGYHGLDDSGQLQEVTGADRGSQWSQDHGEIGWYQRPGGPRTHNGLRLPYGHPVTGDQPAWPRTRLLRGGVGIFQFGRDLGGGAGDFGGNLEILPPTATHKLGRILIGDTSSKKLKDFLDDQEVQEPFEVPTEWLFVGHVDEVLAFTYGARRVVVADPTLAWTVLGDIPAADRGKSVFFATGDLPQDGVASADSTANDRLETGIDLRGQSWEYVRIHDGTAKGQTARIDTLGNGFLSVDRVWNTTSKIVDDGTGIDNFFKYVHKEAPNQATWFVNPKRNDKYVLCEGTRFWYDDMNGTDGTPAMVTVAEVLADADFDALNRTDAQGRIDQIKTVLDNKAGGAGTLTFDKVPVLFFGERAGFATGQSAVAFNPGLANLQALRGRLYFPRQFGPRDGTGADLFEEETRKIEANARFIDDWDVYHRLDGEVHCGSLSRRTFPGVNWWEEQP